MSSTRRHWLVPLLAFLLAFALVPARIMGGFDRFPSDVGDGRLNAYFLENVYQVLIAGSGSLWTLGIFSPYPYTLGFSDNLFGAVPIYIAARATTGDPYLAFMIWWYVAWPVNFAASYIATRKLGLHTLGATTAALVFTFALPITSTFPWPQFAYRFGAILAVAALWRFLTGRGWRYLVAAAAWSVWQFYCGIYMGVFTLVITVSLTLGYLSVVLVAGRLRGLRDVWRLLLKQARGTLARERLAFVAAMGGLVLGMVLLMWPYLQVTRLYHLTRSFAEIQPMLPTYRTYLVNDYSIYWKTFSATIHIDAIRWEHQFFLGLVLMTLLVIGVWALIRSRDIPHTPAALAGASLTVALGIMFVITLNVRGETFWFFVAQLPLFSAIRAVTRIVLVMLIPLAFMAGFAVDWMWASRHLVARVLAIVLGAALVVEAAAVVPVTSPVEEWRNAENASASVSTSLPPDAILFFAQSPGGEWWHDEVTAMWAALRTHRTTINGYSGGMPPGFTPGFGGDCAELPQRVLAYLEFSGNRDDRIAYQNLMRQMVPVGFSSCQASWWVAPPAATGSQNPPTAAELNGLELGTGSRTPDLTRGSTVFDVTVANRSASATVAGDRALAALWYRYQDASGQTRSDWAGVGLSHDLLPGDVGTVSVVLDPHQLRQGGTLEVVVGNAPPSPGAASGLQVAIR